MKAQEWAKFPIPSFKKLMLYQKYYVQVFFCFELGETDIFKRARSLSSTFKLSAVNAGFRDSVLVPLCFHNQWSTLWMTRAVWWAVETRARTNYTGQLRHAESISYACVCSGRCMLYVYTKAYVYRLNKSFIYIYRRHIYVFLSLFLDTWFCLSNDLLLLCPSSYALSPIEPCRNLVLRKYPPSYKRVPPTASKWGTWKLQNDPSKLPYSVILVLDLETFLLAIQAVSFWLWPNTLCRGSQCRAGLCGVGLCSLPS